MKIIVIYTVEMQSYVCGIVIVCLTLFVNALHLFSMSANISYFLIIFIEYTLAPINFCRSLSD